MAAPETPNSRKETYYDSILKDGDTGLTPNNREEMYLDAIDRDLDDIRAEVAKKAESIKVTFDGAHLMYNGEIATFDVIMALIGDHNNIVDVHTDTGLILNLSAFADDAVEFSTEYITGGRVYVDRVIINSDNQIKENEIDLGIRRVHAISVGATTAQGTWSYCFQVLNNTETAYTQLSQVASALYSAAPGVELCASGTYTEGNNVYIVTKVKSLNRTQVTVEMRKLSDGSIRTIETGSVDITDYVM